ncbi:hypothetical protein LSCM1_03136 [Leishmania martiniquensis]|uniref:Uncharacterized protein n=1 Tax=Leishmania martiniquensis TaxID=1580590 RepID=A0A836HAZ7_9TRYP|nr:hypothetical protein LSCM1_03136 [Leishmania martiniquensis]
MAENASTAPAAPAASEKAFSVTWTQGNAPPRAKSTEARRGVKGPEKDAAGAYESVAPFTITRLFGGRRDGGQRAKPRENPQSTAQDFQVWLTRVGEERGELMTAPRTDLSLWFHNERLAAKTPFAAVVPCPVPLSPEKAQRSVSAVVGSFAFPTFFVQTVPMRAKLSEMARVFVQRPAHLLEELHCRGTEEKGMYAYTTVPCHGGSDVMRLFKRSPALRDALRDVPCLLLNDYCPQTPLCLRCLVVAGRCVAAEVVCSEVYAPLFGIQPRNSRAPARGGPAGGADVGMEADKGYRASAAVHCRPSTTWTGENGKHAVVRTAIDVVAHGLQAYVEDVFGQSLGGGSFTAVLAAEVKGFDSTVLGPQVNGPPFWPALTHEPLHLKASPFDEKGLRFYILSLGHADPDLFESFSPEELYAICEHVGESAKPGTALPPALRFLDGRAKERATPRRSVPTPSASAHRSRVAPSSDKKGNRSSSHDASQPPHKAAGVARGASSTSTRAASATATRSSGWTQRKHWHCPQGDEARAPKSAEPRAVPVSPNVRPHRPPLLSSSSSLSTAPVTELSVTAPHSAAGSNAAQRHRRPSNIEAPISSPALKRGGATATSQSDRGDGTSAVSGSCRACCTRLPPRFSSFSLPAGAAASVPVTGAEAFPCVPSQPANPSVASARPSVTGSSHCALPSTQVRLQESIAIDVMTFSMTSASSTRCATPAGCSHPVSTGDASSHSFRLPERRLSKAASSLRDGRHGSVAQSAPLTRAAAWNASAHSSLPLPSRSSAMGAAAVSVGASDASDRAVTHADGATSATKSSTRSTVLSSHSTLTAEERMAAARLVLGQTTTAEDIGSASPLHTGIPTIVSLHSRLSIASSSVSSKPSTRSSYAEPQPGAPRPKERTSVPRLQIRKAGTPAVQAPSGAGKRDADEEPIAELGQAQLPSQAPRALECDEEGNASNKAPACRQCSSHNDDKALKGQRAGERSEAAESALCSSRILPSTSQRSTSATTARTPPTRISTSLLSLWLSEASGAEREESAVSTYMVGQTGSGVGSAWTSSCSWNKTTGEEADTTSCRFSMLSSRFGMSNKFYADESAVAAEAASSPAEDGAGREATFAIEGEVDEHECTTKDNDASSTGVHTKGCDGQPARLLLDFTASEGSKPRPSIPSVEGVEDTRMPAADWACCHARLQEPEDSTLDGEEETATTYYSDYISHARGRSDLRMVNSLDFESCTSIALSGVSSEMTGRWRWFARLALDGSQRPPSNAPSCALSAGIAGTCHKRGTGSETAPSQTAPPLAPASCKAATPVPVNEKSASPVAVSASERYGALSSITETSSFRISLAPSKKGFHLSSSSSQCSVGSALD